jgi:predicted exporter
VLLLPAHTRALSRTPALMNASLWYARRFPVIPDRWVFVSATLVLCALVALFMSAQPSDDVRLLQAKTPALTHEAAVIGALISDQRDSQYLLVEGDSVDSTLGAERSLRLVLDRLVREGKLNAY